MKYGTRITLWNT